MAQQTYNYPGSQYADPNAQLQQQPQPNAQLTPFTPQNYFSRATWEGPGAGGGGSRDEWAVARNDFIQPYLAQFRQVNPGVAADDATVFNSSDFQNFVQHGTIPSAQMQPATANVASTAPSSAFQQKLEGYLDSVLSGNGNFNNALAQSQREGVKDTLARTHASGTNQLKADLASRGLLSLPGAPSGVESRGLQDFNRMLSETETGAVRDIFNKEQQNASDRFLQALGLSTNHAKNLADTLLGSQQLDLNRTLGLGNLALGQGQNELSAALGLGRLDLDRWLAQQGVSGRQADEISKIINDILNANNTASGGFFG